jgi:hypothetical protein
VWTMTTTTFGDAAIPAGEPTFGWDAAVDSRRWSLAVVAEVALRGVLESMFLGRHSLLLGESDSAILDTSPWHRFVDLVRRREANMVLYNVLLRGWVVLEQSEIALRRISVVVATGSLLMVDLAGACAVRPVYRARRRVAPRSEPAVRPGVCAQPSADSIAIPR